MAHKGYIILLLGIFLLGYFPFTISETCPARFPYAFFAGKYCCRFNQEKVNYQYRPGYTDALCDGGVLKIDSECCLEDQYVQCPNAGTCTSLSYDTYPCVETFPYAYYNGQYCCKTAFEKLSYASRGISSGCSGRNLTRDSHCCEGDQFVACAHPPCVNMEWWSLTWNAEGEQGHANPDITRSLRVPNITGYGVTYGRGYDMATQLESVIIGDLTNIGLSQTDAEAISGASTLAAAQGQDYLVNNITQTNITLTRRQEWELFKILRDSKIDAAKLILSDTNSAFGTVDFDTLKDAVKAVVIDLFFRNEYYDNIAQLQPEVVKNTATALVTLMSDRSKWSRASDDRFLRRKTHIVNAAAQETP